MTAETLKNFLLDVPDDWDVSVIPADQYHGESQVDVEACYQAEVAASKDQKLVLIIAG